MSQTAPAFERVLDSLASMPDNSYVHGHFVFDEELHRRARAVGISIVFLYRDRRAALASLAYYLLDRHEPASLARCLPGRDLGTVLRFLVDGSAEAPPFEHFYAPYEGWKDAEGVSVVRFEDIIGPRGGGSTGVQLAVLSSVAGRIGWQGDPRRLLAAIEQTFNPGAGTFRRGTIDGWREDLRELRGTVHWQHIRTLARSWGYVDGLVPLAMNENLAAAVPAAIEAPTERRQRETVVPVASSRAEVVPVSAGLVDVVSRRRFVERERLSPSARPAWPEVRPTISACLSVLRWLHNLPGGTNRRRRAPWQARQASLAAPR